MIKNRLIITWGEIVSDGYKNHRESMRCTSNIGAAKILSRRNKKNILFATFYDKTGEISIQNYE